MQLVALLVTLGLVGCESPESLALASQTRGWNFVQSIGGIAVGTPARNTTGGVSLPIDCDVSGLRTVSVTPSRVNSGIACDPPLARADGQRILVTLNTSPATKKHHDSRCPAADLGPIPAGEYSVLYRDPQGSEHPLGSVQIPH